MKTIKAVKVFLFACLVGIIAGCKLAVIVVEGGEVQSDGSGTCTAGTVCIIEVNDMNFSDAFTAVPATDWYFEKWNAASGFFCGPSNDPTCTLSLVAGIGNVHIEDLVASPATFYLMPIFKPYQDIIVVDGKEWLQPSLFTNLSWNDISAVCPAGACSGMLNGYDVSGWTWASVDDANALFNYYIGSDVLGPGPGSYLEPANPVNTIWASAFFSGGWRTTSNSYPTDHQVVHGWLRDRTRSGVGSHAFLFDRFIYDGGPAFDLANTSGSSEAVHFSEELGGWFHRTP